MDYAKNVKRLREKMLLTQKEFAETLGVGYVTVNRWENGSFEPTMKSKRKLDPLFREYGINTEEEE